MNWLDLLNVSVQLLLSLLAQVKPGTSSADAKVAAEIQAAIDSLKSVQGTVFTLQELESLRTKALW